MKEMHVFDFDGTLTCRDTLFDFLLSSFGRLRVVLALLCMSPRLVLMKLHILDNGKTKERLLSHFFKGWKEQNFESLGQQYARRTNAVVRPKAFDRVRQLLSEGKQVVVVSASIDAWVKPVCAEISRETDFEITVLGTKMEAKDGILTGRFATPNCYGGEKVNRLKTILKDRNNYKIVAYGDSRGDKEMFEYADEFHYRPFE